ncbi:MAG: ATP-binding protein, partial [Hyphomicrobiaceae bacterium]
LPLPHAAESALDSRGLYWKDVAGPKGQPLRLVEMIHFKEDEFGAVGLRYSVVVAGPLDWQDGRLATFRMQIIAALALVGLGLAAATVFQVRFGLLPLQAIERGLAGIRSGAAPRLEGRLPVEIRPLQIQLNALIEANEDIIARARKQAGNLAHALKTPLTVIVNEAGEDKSPFARKVAEQSEIMRVLISHYLNNASAAARNDAVYRVTEVKPAVDALQRALERIYRDSGVAIHTECPAKLSFQGEPQDLDDMLGNLLDNGCKWARSRVCLTVEAAVAARGRLHVVVEDDGPGVTPEERELLGKRGRRLDEAKPGSGLGLSIVMDLAESYHGTLTLDASSLGGLAARLDLPAA